MYQSQCRILMFKIVAKSPMLVLTTIDRTPFLYYSVNLFSSSCTCSQNVSRQMHECAVIKMALKKFLDILRSELIILHVCICLFSSSLPSFLPQFSLFLLFSVKLARYMQYKYREISIWCREKKIIQFTNSCKQPDIMKPYKFHVLIITKDFVYDLGS